MKQCTFKAVDKSGETRHSLSIKGNSYPDALEAAINWFSKLKDRENLHLATGNTNFENKKMPKRKLYEFLDKLKSCNCGEYLVVENENYVREVTDNIKLVIHGSARPNGIILPFTGSNNKIYGYIDEAKGTKLKSLLNNTTLLREELNKLGVVFLDVAQAFLIANGFCGDNDILAFEIDDDILVQLREAQNQNSNLVIVPATSNARHILNDVYRIKSYKLLSLVDRYRSHKDEWVELIRNTL